MSNVSFRLLAPNDASEFQSLRLRGLQDVPEAFGSTYEEDVTLPLEVIADRLRGARTPACRAVIGAFVDDALVGVVGFMQSPKIKSRHTAQVWGMYVAPEVRGRGVGRGLLDALIAEVRACAGVERLTLSVVERAEAARRLYAAFGFVEFGREQDAYRHGATRDTALHLTFELGPSSGT
jgi:ribosomal protein S18 acetylase RimI-like enzyme